MAVSDQDARASDRFGMILLLLVVSFLLSAFLSGESARILPVLFQAAALALALRSVQPLRAGLRRLLWVLVAGSVVALVAAAVQNRVVRGLVSLWLAVIQVLAIVAVVRRILVHRVVTLQTIFGALSAYLLIGFLYAALVSAVAQFQRVLLFADGQPANSSTIKYFSFITMTTVGYGDFTATGEPIRTLAVLDALTGQIFLVTLVARLVSIFGQGRNSRG